MSEASLYDRLGGGAFAIAAVVDHFELDAIVHKPDRRATVVAGPALREWHTNNLGRLPGLKFMRTLWVCTVSGGPFAYIGHEPREPRRSASRRPIGIFGSRRRSSTRSLPSLAGPLDHVGVPGSLRRNEVLAAFAAHKREATEGHAAAV